MHQLRLQPAFPCSAAVSSPQQSFSWLLAVGCSQPPLVWLCPMQIDFCSNKLKHFICLRLSFNTSYYLKLIQTEPALSMSRFGAVLGERHFSKRIQFLKETARKCPLCSDHIFSSWGKYCWDIVIYNNKYIFGLPIPGLTLLQPWRFPKWEDS